MAAILPTLPALPPFDFADAGADYGSIVQDGGLKFPGLVRFEVQYGIGGAADAFAVSVVSQAPKPN